MFGRLHCSVDFPTLGTKVNRIACGRSPRRPTVTAFTIPYSWPCLELKRVQTYYGYYAHLELVAEIHRYSFDACREDNQCTLVGSFGTHPNLEEIRQLLDSSAQVGSPQSLNIIARLLCCNQASNCRPLPKERNSKLCSMPCTILNPDQPAACANADGSTN